MSRLRLNSVALSVVCLVGCLNRAFIAESSWHARYGWVATKYFDDPNVIALCEAIERNDLTEMKRLVGEGVDVNAKGKGGMTPLLWAFPEDKVDRFKYLLESRANPNVVVESDFNTKGALHSGDSVTQLAARSKFPEHFGLVMKHGGDPNLIDPHTNDSLLHIIIQTSIPDKSSRIQILLDLDVKLDVLNDSDVTPTMSAVSWGAQYDLALMLLNAGANPRIYGNKSNKRLIHVVVQEERLIRNVTPQSRADYEAIVRRVTEQGESLDDARKDIDRWMEWGKVYGAKARELIQKEVSDRVAREKTQGKDKAPEKR